jgi:hypothetical protein
MIYEYVIFSDKNVMVCKGDEHSKHPYTIGNPIPDKIRGKTRSGAFLRPAQDERNLWQCTPTLAIASTCRQMHLEAAPIWYACVRFGFASLDTMKSFTQSVGTRNQDAIQHIAVDVNIPSYSTPQYYL